MPDEVETYSGTKNKYRGTLDRTTPAIIAILVVAGGFGFIFYYPDRDSSAVVGLMMLILGYYFGSSKGSSDKNKIILKEQEENEEQELQIRLASVNNCVPDVGVRQPTDTINPTRSQPSITIPQNPNDQQNGVRHDIQDVGIVGQPGEAPSGGEKQSNPVG